MAGVSGSGKTTLAARIGGLLGLPHTEIDSLFHGPNWVPRAEFMSDVEHLTQEPGWVTEWQYRLVRPLLAARADTLVWLDFPVPVSMARLVRRTVRRRLGRVELWNGNLEGPLHTLFTDADHIIRWGWRTRHKLREAMPRVRTAHPQLTIVHLRSPRQAERWLRGLANAVEHGWPAQS